VRRVTNKKNSLARECPLYFALALGGIAAVVGLVAIQVYLGIRDISADWLGFVAWTGVLFWIVVRDCRTLWSRRGFWLILVAFLVIHCTVFVAILSHVSRVATDLVRTNHLR